MSKPGPKPGKSAHSHHAGIYKADTVKDVAESLGITNLPEAVASSLASDVEYREASRFMRHARRTTLTTGDIDLALRTLNIEPLYGHTPHASTTFRRALPFPNMPSAGTVYFVEDEEIDFDKVLREEKIIIPKGVNWTAHWLAVEGVQPLVPENPPGRSSRRRRLHPWLSTANHHNWVSQNHNRLRLHKLSRVNSSNRFFQRELQLYYYEAHFLVATPFDLPLAETAKRTAALARLQALLPYLVKWVGEGVVGALREETDGEQEGRTLEILLDVVSAILGNSTLLSSLISINYSHQFYLFFFTSSLPSSHAKHLRTAAAQTLGRVLTQHSTTYPSLSPRIMKTLLVALLGNTPTGKSTTSTTVNGFAMDTSGTPSRDGSRAPPKPLGTREGAIRGLIGIGKEAVRKGILEGGGARIVGEEITASGGEGVNSVVEAVMMALDTLQPPSGMPETLDPSREEDAKLITQLHELLGDFFASRVVSRGDRGWAAGLVASVSD
ncbi:TATA box binding protein associated factor-domain-containing protein [Pisolithus croceorrhizus]|nr:TATA box binding protein associated factor-domain-containing protein [Pisolithus croceorrhizus]